MTTSAWWAATPQEWINTHLAAHLLEQDRGVDERTRAWLTADDLFTDDAAHLRRCHEQIQDGGVTPAAAAKWLVGWYAGRTAHAVGYFFAFASAAILIDPTRLRFGRHPDGWTQLVDFGEAQVAVVAGHHWSGQPGVRVLEDEEALASAALESLVSASRPVLERVRGFARVGLIALWSEVADEFVLAGTALGEKPADLPALERLRSAIRMPEMPWRKYPDVWVAEAAGRQVHVGQKGGCCLAYLCEQVTDVEPEEDHRRWAERFPPDPEGRTYCNTCSLLERADSEARQVFPR